MARRLGLIGIPLAGLIVQVVVLVPALLPALRTVTGMSFPEMIRTVVAPWAARAISCVAQVALGLAASQVQIWIAIPLGGVVGLASLFLCRRLILDYPPVAQVIRMRLALFRLDGLLLSHLPRQPRCDARKGYLFRRRSALERFASKAWHIVPAPLWAAMRHGYQRALLRVRPESLVSTLPGGERIRMVPALRQLTWNTDEYDVFRRDVRPGDVVFDVGANLGAYTLLFAQWVGPAGRVFAFEPAREPFEGLTKLLDANGLSSRVTAMQAAVSGTEGTASLLVDAVDGSSRILDDDDLRGGRRGADRHYRCRLPA